MTELPDTLDCDDAPYPDETRLQQIREGDAVHHGARWMVETFPKLAEELAPYAYCEITHGADVLGYPEHVISFSTSGWSGCEDFIEAVLGNTMLHMMYYSAWKRGGHHEFRVSRKAVSNEQ
jgi:hypothetical protein